MCQEYFTFSYFKRCYNYMYKNNIMELNFHFNQHLLKIS